MDLQADFPEAPLVDHPVDLPVAAAPADDRVGPEAPVVDLTPPAQMDLAVVDLAVAAPVPVDLVAQAAAPVGPPVAESNSIR